MMNVHEMEGFLSGKCLPGDLLFGESHAEYLVRKLNEATTAKADRDAQQKRADALAVENAELNSGCGFFAYHPDNGFEEFKTKDEAIAAAESYIDYYRGEACDGWPDEVAQVSWGIIMQESTRVNERPRTNDDSCDPAIETVCDYALLPNIETPEGGYVDYRDYASLFAALELANADRDTLLAENVAMKCTLAGEKYLDFIRQNNWNPAVKTVNGKFSCFMDPEVDFGSMVYSFAKGLIDTVATPATSAALAAIEARGVEKFADFLDSPIDGQHCYQNEVGLARHFASTLREAK